MDQLRVAVVVGSLRRESLNRQLADAMARLAPRGFTLQQCLIDDLPPYNQDDDAHPGEPVRRFKSEIAQSQGVIFVTPEYNRSFPGVLKNAIDHGSRPYGQSVWADKPAGIIGISVGQLGTSMAQQHLRNVLAYLDMPTMGQPEIYLQAREGLFKDGAIGVDSTRDLLGKWMAKYAQFVTMWMQTRRH